MPSALSHRTLGVIHTAVFTAEIVGRYAKEIIPEVRVVHLGDDTIQDANLASPVGTIPKENLFRFVTYAHFLQEAGVDLVLLACSTFNRAVEYARPFVTVPMLQIDRAMMELAVREGERVGLLATLASTVPSSERLLRSAGEDAGRKVAVETVLCEAAFQELRSGNVAGHNALLLEEIERLSRRVDSIVLAQVSMSALEPMVASSKVPVFNSGRSGLTRVREILLAAG